MKIPTTLKHMPVIVSENYEQVDGRYAGNTDAKGLSLGLAQWNDRGKVDISAKVWRYTGEKWSRQSEGTAFPSGVGFGHPDLPVDGPFSRSESL